jgi:hypothetical protein
MSQKIMINTPKNRKFHPLYTIFGTKCVWQCNKNVQVKNMKPPPWLPWRQVINVLLYQENTYATTKLQILPSFTPFSTKKKSAPFYF